MSIQAIRNRKKEINKKLNAVNGNNISNEEIRSLKLELDKLDYTEDYIISNEEDNPLAAPEDYEGRNNPQGQFNVIGTYGVGTVQQRQGDSENQQSIESMEQRAADLQGGKEVSFDFNLDSATSRAMIPVGAIPFEEQASTTLNKTFSEVSSLGDLTKVLPLKGAESYKSGFIISIGSADYTDAGEDYFGNDEVQTDFVKIDKAKITTYFELPEELHRLGGPDYLHFAREAAQNAILKKIGQQILVGAGGTNALHGILNAPTNVIPADSDLEVSEFDETLLDDLVFSHGGDEALEGGAYLILNKNTLAEFSKVRATDGKRLYNIKMHPDGNVGTISSEESFEVPFIINSALKSYADAAEDEYFLVYGKPRAYELAIFGELLVTHSTDFKFRSGQTAVKASIFAGGNTASYKGFTRVKKVL